MTLITDDYKDQIQQLHATKQKWGSRAHRWNDQVVAFGRGLRAATVLDYGAGKGALRPGLELAGFVVREYDPGIPGKDALPGPADMVVCLDVLEHIEPDCLNDVLAHMGGLAVRGLYANVALYPAGNWLPDGRNAHLIIESPEWWQGRIKAAWTFPCRLEFEMYTRPSRPGSAKKPKASLIVRMERL